MPVYGFRCTLCGRKVNRPTRDITISCCRRKMVRDYSFSIGPSFEEGYNSSVGMYVSNRRQLNDAMKVASESASHYTGIDHSFVPRDPQDHEAFGIKSEHIEESKEYFTKQQEKGLLSPTGEAL